MFTPISVILGLLFFASTLPNGIRLVELPSEGEFVEIVAGYTSGGLAGFASTAGARSLLFDAYAAGARIDRIDELDRSALRISAPKWALSMLAARVPGLFKEGAATAATTATAPEFREKVEEEIRSALLGSAPSTADYSTSDAFVLISAPVPDGLREALAAVPKRGAPAKSGEETINRLPAERTLRFKSDLPEGAVIFASPIPGAYYRQWYLVLLLDRLIHRIVPLRLKTTMTLSSHPYYYRLELVVPAGQFPEPAEENLLQELQRLQFTPANARDLTAARQEALAYLDSKPIREWFASHDMLARRDEGIQWIETMSADDLRVAARDLLIMNRVIASWAPKPRQTSVTTESLNPVTPSGSSKTSSVEGLRDVGPVEISQTPFPPHAHAAVSAMPAERLSSGISLSASTTNAVFVSGAGITRFDRELTVDDLKPFQQYRSDRILVLTPASSRDRARQLWNGFKGSTSGESGVSRGKVSSGDLSALFILKTILDLKVIQAGWWREVTIGIDAGEGSMLQIRATEDQRTRILEWIKASATELPEAYFSWVREVAIHQFDNVHADLQALTWERDPQGSVPALDTVSAKHVQDVARIYF